MTYVVIFALLLLITLLGAYIRVENNRKKALETKKKQFNERVAQVSTRLKAKLNSLLEAKIIRPKYVAQIQAIVTNFFVVQPHTDENLQHLEDISDSLVSTLSIEFQKALQSENAQALQDNIQYFVSELPQQGILYNKAFYHEIFPSLMVQIKTDTPVNPSESLENTDETPSDESTDSDRQFSQNASVA